VIPTNIDDLDELLNAGVFGIKAFLTHSGIDEFPNVTEADLRRALPILKKHDATLLVHCELEGRLSVQPADARDCHCRSSTPTRGTSCRSTGHPQIYDAYN
jgi:dihydroorotase-like cyclic amidohydrolase